MYKLFLTILTTFVMGASTVYAQDSKFGIVTAGVLSFDTTSYSAAGVLVEGNTFDSIGGVVTASNGVTLDGFITAEFDGDDNAFNVDLDSAFNTSVVGSADAESFGTGTSLTVAGSFGSASVGFAGTFQTSFD